MLKVKKMLTSSVTSYCDKVMSKNPKNWANLMKIANIDREFLHVFWKTWGNSMKFSGKMCFKITLKVTKKPQCFLLSLEDKTKGLNLSPAVLGLI